jgi:hypothetical protein
MKTKKTSSFINQIIHGDCLKIMQSWSSDCVDLVFTSPPYENARVNCGKLTGKRWVEWAEEIYIACYRACHGLTAWVVEGRTKNFHWSATPIMLMNSLIYAGVPLRKPPIYHRVGIPGSGGPDWLRNDYEFIICASKGKLPWSDNTAMGHPPKWAPGGEMSHRISSGARVNQWGHSIASGATVIKECAAKGSWGKRNYSNTKAGVVKKDRWYEPPEKANPGNVIKGPSMEERNREGPHRVRRKMQLNGELPAYTPPVKANPGNVIKLNVGGGQMGSKLAHEHPAPFPESLAEFFIKSFCPPGGLVCDPFCGSGTTLAVAKRLGRNYIGIDIDKKWCDLSQRRVEEVQCP